VLIKVIAIALRFAVQVVAVLIIQKIIMRSWAASKMLWNARTVRIVLEKR